MYINVVEFKAAFTGIRIYCHNRSYKPIRVMSDSYTAIAYINNKGGINSKKCNEIAKEIWLRCFKNNSLISAAHNQENRILKLTNFLGNLTIIQNGNLILRYLLKLLISLAPQKLIFLLPE